ncbi:MAG: phage portal protein [Actinophytocola sp.]|uniref:phage portal protein n=1 Tax=Actinophytocola sp. TaxID=1872138 RepID=UPI003D6B8922
MALSEDNAKATVATLLDLRQPEQERLNRIARYVRGKHSSVYVPKGAKHEYRWLIDRAKQNMLRLVINVVAQNLYVDGYRPATSDDNAPPWEIWQANRMDARQHGVHRAALKYGVSYNLVLPGTPEPVITPMSPRRLTAFYADPVNDEWPLYALDVTTERTKEPGGKPGEKKIIRLFDDTSAYRFEAVDNRLDFQSVEDHDLGVCPAVRYLNEVDLDEDEAVAGEVEPLIEIQDQINSTTFGLLMAQQYAAFRQRWATGMVTEDEQGRPLPPPNAGVDRLLTNDSTDARFGEFEATPLDGYLKSREESVRAMATISQTPPYYLLGVVANLSAESLAAARDGLDRKVEERKSTFGESHEQTLRLAAKAKKDIQGWDDTSAQVVWRDTSTRALAQTVDALGKLVQMLKVPEQALWERIPGVTQTDIKRWQEIAADAEPDLNRIAAGFLTQQGGQRGPGDGQLPDEPAPGQEPSRRGGPPPR